MDLWLLISTLFISCNFIKNQSRCGKSGLTNDWFISRRLRYTTVLNSYDIEHNVEQFHYAYTGRYELNRNWSLNTLAMAIHAQEMVHCALSQTIIAESTIRKGWYNHYRHLPDLPQNFSWSRSLSSNDYSFNILLAV